MAESRIELVSNCSGKVEPDGNVPGYGKRDHYGGWLPVWPRWSGAESGARSLGSRRCLAGDPSCGFRRSTQTYDAWEKTSQRLLPKGEEAMSVNTEYRREAGMAVT